MTVEHKSEKSKHFKINQISRIFELIIFIIIYNLPHIVDISNNLANKQNFANQLLQKFQN